MRREVDMSITYPNRSHDPAHIVRIDIMDTASRELIISVDLTAEQWVGILASRYTTIPDAEITSNPERLGKTCITQSTLLGRIEEDAARAWADEAVKGGVWQDARASKQRAGWHVRLRRWE